MPQTYDSNRVLSTDDLNPYAPTALDWDELADLELESRVSQTNYHQQRRLRDQLDELITAHERSLENAVAGDPPF